LIFRCAASRKNESSNPLPLRGQNKLNQPTRDQRSTFIGVAHMLDKNPVVQVLPYAVRRKEGMRLAGVGSTEFQNRVNSGRYKSFLDGALRYVVTQSIIDDQKRLAEATKTPDPPLGKGSRRRGRPKKPKP
jgi:hypothetical protein